MSNLAVAGVVTAAAAVLYVVLGVLYPWRARRDRRLAAELPGVEIDPYHAVAVAFNSNTFVYRSAAAALLLDDLITIHPEGRMLVTARGGDPAETPEHPVPAALLDCLRGLDQPVALSELHWQHELRDRCDAFRREQW
ncbi:hypothetical protein ACFPIJ_45650 [Dactylosporangium cerinum]|uniref:Uncharacterized protein n=1 Tax=Dactylosporangium cerinum TaxID=1434730 RepID=A0ABV9WBG3_9ACTN